MINVSYSHQWIRNDGTSDTDIENATGTTYTLVAADEEQTLKVRVSFADDEGNDETLTSAATGEVEALPNRPATGAPSISGTAQVGETLTAETSGIADADGLSGATFTYQWIANDGTADTDIQDATYSTYTLVSADEGQTLKVRVSFADDEGNDESLTSVATAAVAAEDPQSQESPAKPTGLTGTVSHNAVSLSWDDPDDDTITGYQILRRDRALHRVGEFLIYEDDTGSALPQYVDQDVELEVRYVYRIKARNAAGLSKHSHWFQANTPAATTDPNSPATGAPTVTGTAEVGETLTADTSGIADANGLAGTTFTYQWVRGADGTDTDISAATDSTRTIVAAADGQTIKVRVSFTDDDGHAESLTSAATEAVSFAVQQQTANNPATGEPVITGKATVGETLKANTTNIADADGLSHATFTYQWITNDGTDDTDIQDATDATYTLADADEGKAIKVRVSFTDDADNEETLTSTATVAVAAATQPNSPATGAPTISGTAQVGETLTADTSGIADEDGLENVSFSYQWIAIDGTTDADIAGATASTYTLVDTNEGKTAKVRVSFTDDEGNEETLTTAATAAVAAAPTSNSPATGAPTISGTAQVGETLTADTSGIADEDGLENVTFSYQWLAAAADIPGATESAYTLSEAVEGKAISVQVSFTDDGGDDETLTSAATEAVAGNEESLTS